MTDLSQDSVHWDLAQARPVQTAQAPIANRLYRATVYSGVFVFNVLAWYALIMLVV